MLKDWLEEIQNPKIYNKFNVIGVTEKTPVNKKILDYLTGEIVNCYRNNKSLLRFGFKTKEQLYLHLNKHVFPSCKDKMSKNVKIGDFGEILTSIVIKEFRNLFVPIYKFRWKFNNNRSTFGTDVMAHNIGEKITDIIYYEVKTRSIKDNNIAIKAHNELLNDIPNESIAVFLQNYYVSIADIFEKEGVNDKADKYYTLADKYSDIVLNPKKYKKQFEIVVVTEAALFNDLILDKLEKLPPSNDLKNLSVSTVLIQNIKKTIEEAYSNAINIIWEEIKKYEQS